MDGTLTDTAKATIGACNVAAAKIGFPPLGLEQIQAAMGYPGLEFVEVLLGDIDRDTLLAFQRETDSVENKEIRRIGRNILFPGVRETLEGLHLRGAELFVASTGSPEHVNLLTDITGIRSLFSGIFSDMPRKVKMTAKIMAGFTDKTEWLFVGDKRIDAEAAKGNGILAVGAGFGYCTEPSLFDMVITIPQKLLDMF
jgi:phosphoglycolate phosphatase-like HAD superfamily hydrolase